MPQTKETKEVPEENARRRIQIRFIRIVRDG